MKRNLIAILALFSSLQLVSAASRHIEMVETLPASDPDTSSPITVGAGESITPVASIPVSSPLGGVSGSWTFGLELRFSPEGEWYPMLADNALGGGTSVSIGTTYQGPVEARLRYNAYSGSEEEETVRVVFLIEGDDADENLVPTSSVVIPTDASGPVEIILESSADLVTWTQAVPGTYSSSTENRFFRVRAVVQSD